MLELLSDPQVWIAFATLTALLPLFWLPPKQSVAALVLALATTLWLARLFKRRIGGYTGDVLGAIEQVAEIAMLLCLAALL